jgi:CRP-like cAMP-binding protein
MEGSGGAAFFLIDSGQATVSSKGVHLATLGPGDYFGEIALIDGGPRMATVTAATDLVCYGLTFWEFRPLIERNGAIGWKLLQALAKRFRDFPQASPITAASPAAGRVNTKAVFSAGLEGSTQSGHLQRTPEAPTAHPIKDWPLEQVPAEEITASPMPKAA